MFVPIPILVAIGVALLALVLFLLRSNRRHETLMGEEKARRYSPPEAAPPAVVPMSPEAEQRVRALLAAGRKIEAVRVAREATLLGLGDAKALVESLK